MEMSEEIPHLFRLGRLQVPQVDDLVDTTWSNESWIQLLGVIGGHDQDAVGAIDDSIQNIEQP